MKLLIIVLSLLSERYLIHSISQQRFNWFGSYYQRIVNAVPQNSFLLNPYLLLALVVLPPVLLLWLLLGLIGGWFFGFIGFMLHLFIFIIALGLRILSIQLIQALRSLVIPRLPSIIFIQ